MKIIQLRNSLCFLDLHFAFLIYSKNKTIYKTTISHSNSKQSIKWRCRCPITHLQHDLPLTPRHLLFPALARLSVRMPTQSGVATLASTPITHARCRIHLPLCHTLSHHLSPCCTFSACNLAALPSAAASRPRGGRPCHSTSTLSSNWRCSISGR